MTYEEYEITRKCKICGRTLKLHNFQISGYPVKYGNVCKECRSKQNHNKTIDKLSYKLSKVFGLNEEKED